jgi:hypothetical protein
MKRDNQVAEFVVDECGEKTRQKKKGPVNKKREKSFSLSPLWGI